MNWIYPREGFRIVVPPCCPVFAGDEDATFCFSLQSDDRAGERRLSTPGFTDHAMKRAARDGKGDAVHGPHSGTASGAGAEMDF